VTLFLQELRQLCQKHGVVLTHDAWDGYNIVKEYDEDDMKYLEEAQDETWEGNEIRRLVVEADNARRNSR
jgi:UV DNA damage repair endonuclease